MLGFEASPWVIARWAGADDPAELKRLLPANRASAAEDVDGAAVLLIRNDWELGRFQQDWPKFHFAFARAGERS